MTFSDVILNIYRAWSNVHRRCVMTYNFQTGPGSNIIFLQFKFELCMSLSIFFSCLPVCLSGCLSVCLVACLAHPPSDQHVTEAVYYKLYSQGHANPGCKVKSYPVAPAEEREKKKVKRR